MIDALDLRPSVIVPDWPAPANVGAFVTTRETGPSQGPYAAFNPASHVGDKPEHVELCRRQLSKELGDERPLLWLGGGARGASKEALFEVRFGKRVLMVFEK